MKLWHCSYQWYGAFGAFQYYDCIAIADTAEKAIELAMSKCEFGKTKEDWSATEIPMENNTSHIISERTN